MPLTYNDFRERIDIQDVLRDAGYHLNRRDGLRWPSYVRVGSDGRRVSGDKFIVTANGKGCFHPPEQKVYSVVSFIIHHPDLFQEYRPGMNTHHLVNLVCNRLLNQPIDRSMHNIIEHRRQAKPFSVKDYQFTYFQKLRAENIRKFGQFFNSRMIKPYVQRALSSYFMLSTKRVDNERNIRRTNLAFPLTVPGGKDIVGLEERGRPRLDGSSGYKGKALGSNASEGLWIASPKGTELKDARHVLWFESAYDAMAYYQLHAWKNEELRRAVYLSTGGNPTVMQFRGVIREAPEACHHLCFDNDMAGRQFAKNFHTELRHVREGLPKVGEDMKDYMASLRNPDNLLSGDEYRLPKDLQDAYGLYENEADELYSMKTSGLCPDFEIEEQTRKAMRLHEEYYKKLTDKLCIGQEQGRLKEIGTYDIPDWAIPALENGDYEGLTEEETDALNRFIDKHFPKGFVSDVKWDDINEFNTRPAFGPRNPHSLPDRGESPYQAVKTYAVRFFDPQRRDGEALPKLTVVREVPPDGSKDWNDMLFQKEMERIKTEILGPDGEKKIASGIDLDSDGEVELNESDEKKQTGRQRLGYTSILILLMLLSFTVRSHAQAVTANPGEHTILAAGNSLINETVGKEADAQRGTAVVQNTMAAEFTTMKGWEKKYNSYLKTANGYASALKAATHIYDDGLRILITLDKLRRAVNNNSQGIAATVSMNNLYIETTTEMVSVFTLLKDAVAKGGESNMFTGAERSKTLWELEDRLSSFSHKLRQLYLSIRHYRMADVWNRATDGMIERDRRDVALQSLSHWKRYAKEVSLYSK